LGGVAAIATVVGLFSKVNSNVYFSCDLISVVFFYLILFWVAIWILDFRYYNRLPHGAVEALLKIEEMSKTQTHIKEITLSKLVEDSVAGVKRRKTELHNKLTFGRRWFYILVLLGLILGFLVSLCN